MITLLNAAPDTGNQGVSALCLSVLSGLSSRNVGPVTVADHGRGLRRANLGFGDIDLIGLSHTRRYWRSESLATVRVLTRIGGGFSATARKIAKSRTILDVSGGDSFTDLYGTRRFRAMVLSKQLALDNGLPLILLPQTLGPFRDSGNRNEAVRILSAARAVWTRDVASLVFLKEALGSRYDPARHRLGLDMAVALPKMRPEQLLPAPLHEWLSVTRDFPLAGLNVSGLLSCRPEVARDQFGLAARHDDQVEAAARSILDHDTEMRLLLVSHVHRHHSDPESDLSAATALKAKLAISYPDRVQVLPGAMNAMELKWVMARLDWFAGARMHATIGAFSAGTPTLGLGYSDKAAGVFTQCGIGNHVADLRTLDAAAIGQAVTTSLAQRVALKSELDALLPHLSARAEAQMDAIVQQINA